MAQEFQRLTEEDLHEDEILMLCRLSKTEHGQIARRRFDVTSVSESQCVQNLGSRTAEAPRASEVSCNTCR